MSFGFEIVWEQKNDGVEYYAIYNGKLVGRVSKLYSDNGDTYGVLFMIKSAYEERFVRIAEKTTLTDAKDVIEETIEMYYETSKGLPKQLEE